MRYRKLSILACCAAVSLASATQPAPDNSDDQAKALEALRQTENTPPAEQPVKPKKKLSRKERKAAAQAAAQAAPVAVAPAPAPVPTPVPAASAEDQTQALEA